MLEDLILNLALLFGSALAVLWLGRVILFRFAPASAVGPGGFLIDTTGRLGAFQMHDTTLTQDQGQIQQIGARPDDPCARDHSAAS